MRKKSIIFIFGLLLVPSITFAAWWNPFTWSIFNNPSDSKIEQTKEDQLPDKTLQEEVDSGDVYTFYLQAHTNVRSCPSLGCKILKVEPKNNTILFSKRSGYTDASKLPEWISFSWKENGIEKSGYVNSTLLDMKPAREISTIQQDSASQKQTSYVEDAETKRKNERSLAEINKLLDEVGAMVEENAKLPQCGGRAWKECPAGYTFQCSADGVARCSSSQSQNSYSPQDEYKNEYRKAVQEYYACGDRYKAQKEPAKARTAQSNQEFQALVDSVGGIEAATKKLTKDSNFQKEWEVATKKMADSQREELYISQAENRECGAIVAPYVGPTYTSDRSYDYTPTRMIETPKPYVSPLTPTCVVKGSHGNIIDLDCDVYR